MMKKLNFKLFFGSQYFIFLISLVAVVLSVTGHGGKSFLMLILTSIIYLWTTKWDWSAFGIGKVKSTLELIGTSFLWAIGIIVFAVVAIPIIERFFGEQDLSYFNPLRGNLTVYLLTLVQVWIIAGFFEEFVFRGYLLPHWVKIFGKESNWTIVAGSAVCSIVFGLGHFYQGWTGVILTGLIGFILCIAFYFNKKNLTYNILIHGLVDTVFLTLVYADLDKYLL
jgi:hypothetical protein